MDGTKTISEVSLQELIQLYISRLRREKPCLRTGDPENNCVLAEHKRPLTKIEADSGWKERFFWAYNPRAMCPACSAYWHAAMSLQLVSTGAVRTHASLSTATYLHALDMTNVNPEKSKK